MAAEALPHTIPIMPESDEWFGNLNYGLAQVLREYAGWTEPVQAIILHGVNFEPSFVHDTERLGPPVALTWPQRKDLAFAAAGKAVIPSCAPFLYVKAMRGDKDDRERVGTLFFPAHSTHGATDDTDWDELAACCETLPQPVTVVMHWIDVAKERAHHFAPREPVMAGEIFDPLFLARLHWLYAGAECVASNSPGSCLFYAVAAGVPSVGLHGRLPIRTSEPEFMPSAEALLREVEIREAFGPPIPVSDELRALVDDELGASRFRSPQALHDDLAAAKAMTERANIGVKPTEPPKKPQDHKRKAKR